MTNQHANFRKKTAPPPRQQFLHNPATWQTGTNVQSRSS